MEKILFTDKWTYGLKGDTKIPVLLPHDAMQLQERDPEAKSGSGCAYFPGGCYTYEKTWMAPAEYEGKQLILHFEGVYRNTTVKVNGKVVCEHAYGYSPFWIDITDAVQAGKENLIEVEADNSQTPNSRWYSGGGIYRPVWLWVGGKINIKPCGIKVKTLSADPAVVQVTVDTNAEDAEIEIYANDQLLASAEGLNVEFTLENANLWDEHHPDLYVCKAMAKQNGQIVDTAETAFGVRVVECSPKGLFVNGVNTLLRGGCIHADNGIIGAASYPEAEYRKVKILKEAGFNAIRMAHNPASPALLDACDRLGMYVMDEGWDMWYKRKTKHDYGKDFMDNYENDIQAIVDTDYNHPSVIMYSIGNEISEPAEEKGVELAGKLAEGFRKLDDTRIITVGCNITILMSSQKGEETFDPDSDRSDGTFGAQFGEMDSTKFNEIISQMGGTMENAANSPEADRASSPLFEKTDVAGYNYASGRYEMDGELHPERVIVGSETMPYCIYRNWQYVKKFPYLIGDFMWTAIDYVGEAGIGAWSYEKDGIGFTKPYPWLLGDTGALDLLGVPTGEMFMAQAAWDLLDAPVIAASPDYCHPGTEAARGAWRGTNTIPSWSFAGCEGNPGTVEIHSTDAYVELVLNGKSLGKKETESGMAVFACNYEPGVLEAVSYDHEGRETGRSKMESARGELSIRLTQENKKENKAGSLVFVNVDLVRENGVIESNADTKLKASVEGGTLIGFGSANPRTTERFAEGVYSTFYGRALAAIVPGEKGVTKLKVSGAGLQAELVIK